MGSETKKSGDTERLKKIPTMIEVLLGEPRTHHNLDLSQVYIVLSQRVTMHPQRGKCIQPPL